MKLKFTESALHIIEAIAALPLECTNNKDILKPITIIMDFDKKLFIERHKNKLWAMKRLQLGFFIECRNIAYKNKTSPEHGYTSLIKMFRSILSGDALTYPYIVKRGLVYGVIVLTDNEIQGLIDSNIVN